MRRHLWVKAPMRVTIDGVTYAVAEWSVGGVAIDLPATPETEKLPLICNRQPSSLQVGLPFQGLEIRFDATGELESWTPSTGRAVVAFRGLGQREHDLLYHFVEQLMRGNMATVGETIQRLGAPLTVAELVAPVDSAKRSAPRRVLRTIAMSVAYAAIGIAAVGYLGSLLYTSLFWLEAPTSMISAPTQSLVSLGDGVVTWTTFKPGDAVKVGDVVLKISDTVLEREIEQAEISIRERENKLAFLARRFESEKKRLGALAGLSNLKSAHANAEIEGLNAKLQAAQKELRQLPATAVGPLAQLRQRIVSLKQAIALKGLDVSARASLSRENTGSLEFVGQTVVGDMDNLAAQIELAEADILVAQQRHQAFINQRDRLSLRAPFDGVLRDLTHADTATVRKGDVAAVIERAEQRTVTAYLRQDQLLRVQLGAPAVVHVPATRQNFKATVAEINPARSAQSNRSVAGSSQNTGAPHRDDGMAAVRLLLAGPVRPDDANVYRDGLPAVTMIGLAVLSQPWTGANPTKSAATTSASVPVAGAPSTAEHSGWFRRALSSSFAFWSRSPRPVGG